MMRWTMKISSSHCLTKLLRVLNLRKTSIIFTVSSLGETSDISKWEQFHISDIYLDCKEAKQERFLKSREDRPDPFSLSQWKNSNQLYLTLGWTPAVGPKVPMAAKWSGDKMFYFWATQFVSTSWYSFKTLRFEAKLLSAVIENARLTSMQRCRPGYRQHRLC